MSKEVKTYTNEYVDQLIENINKKDIFIFVDGSYNPEKKMYGCGIVLLFKKTKKGKLEVQEKKISGNHPEYIVSRNIAGEIVSVIVVLKSILKKVKFNDSQDSHASSIKKISLFYDYTGIADWFNNPKVKAKAKISKMYVNETIELAKQFEKLNIEICFYKIKAHNGQKYNELADKLAKQAANV